MNSPRKTSLERRFAKIFSSHDPTRRSIVTFTSAKSALTMHIAGTTAARALAAGIAETLFRIAIYALDITAACDTEPRKEMGTPPPVANVRDALGCNARMYLRDALDHCTISLLRTSWCACAIATKAVRLLTPSFL